MHTIQLRYLNLLDPLVLRYEAYAIVPVVALLLLPENHFFSRGQIWRSQLTLSRSIEQAISTAYTTDAHNQVVCKGSISTCS